MGSFAWVRPLRSQANHGEQLGQTHQRLGLLPVGIRKRVPTILPIEEVLETSIPGRRKSAARTSSAMSCG